MKTSAITNPLATTGNSASAKAGAPSDLPFDQVLSREVASRSNASELNAPTVKNNKPAAQAKQTDQAASAPSKSNEAPPADEGNTASAAEATSTTVSEGKAAADTTEAKDEEETTVDAATAELLALVASLNQSIAGPAKPTEGKSSEADEAPKDIAIDVIIDVQQTSSAPTVDLAENTAAATAAALVAAAPEAALVAAAPEAALVAAATTPLSTVADSTERALPSVDVSRNAETAPGAGKRNVHAFNALAKNITSPAARVNTQAESESSDVNTRTMPKADAPALASDSVQMPESGAAKTQASHVEFATLTSDLSGSAKAHELPTAAPLNIGVLMAAQQQNPVQTAAAAATNNLTPYVGNPGWDQALGQKVVWMVSNAQQSASLTLNPPDLGPLQVVLNVSNNHATADFTAAQPEVRQALENAMPKLREMLSDAGIQLGQANVSAGTPNSQQGAYAQRESNRQTSRGGKSDDVSDSPVQISTSQVVTAGKGLVDTFV
jgi:flagellar hook-length control protein FliK